MKSCAWCQEQIDATSTFCGRCGQPVLASAVRIHRASGRYVFGEAEGDRAAIWDLSRLPEPAFVQPNSKLKMVSDTYDFWEAAEQRLPMPERGPDGPVWVSSIAIAFGILWAAAWAFVPSSISVLGFKGSCGTPLFTASTKSNDPFVQQCAHQSAQHLVVGIAVGILAIAVGAVVGAVGRRVPAPQPSSSLRAASMRTPRTASFQQPAAEAEDRIASRATTEVDRPQERSDDLTPAASPPTKAPRSRRPWMLGTAIVLAAVVIALGIRTSVNAHHRPSTNAHMGAAAAHHDTRLVAPSDDGLSDPGADGLLSPGADPGPPNAQAPTAAAPVPLTDYGYGPVKLGMTSAQLTATSEVASDATRSAPDGGCPQVALKWPSSRALLATDPNDGQLKVVAIAFGPGMKTSRGIGTGSSLAQARRAYPNAAWSDYSTQIPVGTDAYYSIDLNQQNKVEELILTSTSQACFG